MLTTALFALASFTAAFTAQPGTQLPSCYHPDPWYYYHYTREQPEGCSDECWEPYWSKVQAAVRRYDQCAEICAANYPNGDPFLCVCFQACANAFVFEASFIEADLWICMAQ